MDIVNLFFQCVDVVFHPIQNYKRLDNVAVKKDIVFDDKFADICKYDIYYDIDVIKSKKPMPIFINIHGGGFVKGDKKHRVSFAQIIADQGWFVVNVNYRLAPDYPFPAGIQDVFSALMTLSALSKEYNIDLDKVAFSGDSAGAYYATLAYAACKSAELREGLGLPNPPITCVGLLSYSGLYSCPTAFSKKMLGLNRKLAGSFLGEEMDKEMTVISKTKYAKYLSPIDFVNEDWGTLFLSFAKKDVFLAGQGEIFIRKLKENGIEFESDVAEELSSNHCYHLLFYRKASKRCMAKSFAYLKEIRK